MAPTKSNQESKHPIDTHCPAFQVAVGLLARPWTASILNELQSGPKRFTEITEDCRGIGDKVLSARLKELEGFGLLTRTVEQGPPVKVIYSLTETGSSFQEVAKAIERWGRSLHKINTEAGPKGAKLKK